MSSSGLADRHPLPDPSFAGSTEDRRSDGELVLAVRNGDSAAYAELYQRYHLLAVRVARRAGITGDDAEDVVAEAYAKVLRALRGGRGPTENFPGYLATAVRRVAWTVHDEAARCRPTEDIELFDDLSEVSADELKDSAIGAALAALPRSSRSLLWRVVVEGDRVGDIARELDKSPNAVSAAACRARKRLRSEYQRLLA